MTNRCQGVFAVVLGLAAGCITYGESVDPTVEAQLDASSKAFSVALVQGDLDALARLYTRDARLMPPGRVVVGRDAIKAYFQTPNRRQLEHVMRRETLNVRGSMAVETGTWSNTYQEGDAEPVTTSDRYLLVWVQQADGVWRMLIDMWHRPS